MIKCPNCSRGMNYKSGKSSKGYEYEFYGCSGYPVCKTIVKMEDAQKYDDGKMNKRSDRTIEEEAEDFRDILLSEGYSWEDADYARQKWEKDK